MKSNSTNLEINAKLNIINELCANRLDDFLDHLNVKLRKSGKLMIGCCPIHGGDNHSAFNLYPNGNSFKGNWYCRTKQCHKIFKSTLLGLTRGVISKEKYNWDVEFGQNKIATFEEAKNYLLNFIGKKWNEIKPDLIMAEKNNFILSSSILNMYKNENKWTIEQAEKLLSIPSAYFVSRGFSKDIIERYHIGDSLSTDKNSLMYNRAVVPILDDSGNYIIGTTGRSKEKQCLSCNKFHDISEDCPTKEYYHLPRYNKWVNSKGFSRDQHLYNIWKAKEHIKSKNQIILVEGPIDCLRLVEAGFENCLALFGNDLTDSQLISLENMPATNVLLIGDSDKAGINGVQNINKKLRRLFNIKILFPDKKDVGEMTIKEIKEFLK